MRSTLPICLILFAVCTPAQTVDPSLTFDVASVKPADFPKPDKQGRIMMAPPTGGPGTKDPGRIHYPFVSLRNLIMTAYDVKTFQVQGPAWLDSARFEITATMPPDTTTEKFHVMLRNLLAERFRLAIHRDTKELPMYSLTVAKNGPKLKESEAVTPADDAGPPPPPLPPPGPPKMGRDGFPDLPLPAGRGLFMMMMPGRARLLARQQTMLDLANRLGGMLNRPVTDNTGLKAHYDFIVTFSPEGMAPSPGLPMGPGMMVQKGPPPAGAGGGVTGGGAGDAPQPSPDAEPAPDIFRAVKEQLGLALELKKGPVELIVIDRVEKTPTEN